MAEVGLAVPEVDEGPDLWPGNEEYLGAFFQLSDGRPWISGMHGAFPQPILMQELLAALDLTGLARDTEEADEFCTHVRALDREWLTAYTKRQGKAGRRG